MTLHTAPRRRVGGTRHRPLNSDGGIAARAADKQSVGGFKQRGFRVSVTLRSLREEGRELRVAANASEG